jgi:hypothetical protein
LQQEAEAVSDLPWHEGAGVAAAVSDFPWQEEAVSPLLPFLQQEAGACWVGAASARVWVWAEMPPKRPRLSTNALKVFITIVS